jgi:hypothetical protein
MSKVPNENQPRADLVERAVRALTRFGVGIDRGQAETLLSMWTHAAELTDVEREHVLNAFGGVRLTTDEPCPPWCVTDHGKVYEDYTRTCSAETAYVETVDCAGRADDGALYVEATRTIHLESQTVNPPLVEIGDMSVTPSAARQLAELIVRAANVAEGHTS